jgi:hypothetical protein
VPSVSINSWYEALGSQYGVVIQCEGNPVKVREKLYALRRDAKDPDLECLSIVQSPSNLSQLWIVKVPADETP